MRPSLFARAKVLVSDALIHPVHARLLRLLLDQAVGRSAGTVSAGNTADTMPVTSDQRLSRAAVAQWVAFGVAITGKPWLGLDQGTHPCVCPRAAGLCDRDDSGP